MNTQDIPLNRLYDELSYLWPLMSPPGEYAEEAGYWLELLREQAGPGRHEILELGVGGGHNLSHLTAHFDATAVDISAKMLAHSRRLNPSVVHHVGDMRKVRLGRRFKAVLIHDAINHMLSENDLLATFRTAAAHLEPSGVLIVTPDFFTETFFSPCIECRTRINEEMQLTCFEYAHDPNPQDTTIETVFTHLIREKESLRIEHDRMVTGLFPKETWVRLISEIGFAFEERSYPLRSINRPYLMLIGRLQGSVEKQATPDQTVMGR
jgi:SAM-dependent methyltransferase